MAQAEREPGEFAASLATGNEAEFARAKAWLAVLLSPCQAGDAAVPAGDVGALDCKELFRFRYAGQDSPNFLMSWKREASSKSLDERRIEHRVIWKDPAGRLTVRLECIEYRDFPALEYVLYARNDGPDDSDILEEFYSLHARWLAPGTTSVLHRSDGSHAGQHDFEYEPIRLAVQQGYHSFAAGQGRSSNDHLPFWNFQTDDRGIMVGLGWSGQWHINIWRSADRDISIAAHQETLRAKLHPGEEIRTPRALLIFWQGDSHMRGHNMLRRWILTHRTPRPNGKMLVGPYCQSSWGGWTTKEHLETLATIEGKTKHEYYWIDAGWYGYGQPTINEHVGDWHAWTGSWNVNPNVHPNGFGPIVDVVKAQGKKFLLWYETERALNNSDWYKQHPDFFLGKATPHGNALLNLGNPQARRFLTDFVCGQIAENRIDCYRHDFNTDPLPFWRAADTEDRQGMTENLYVQGLYAWWDEMLAKFPHLLIDNCCSGGRRIDLELIGRSITLWRSDFQCYPEAFYEGWDEPSQVQLMGLSYWVPLFGAGARCNCDTYNFRGQFGAALTLNYVGFNVPPGSRDEHYAWYAKMEEQYLRARPFFYGDYYPLTYNTVNPDTWAAMQFDRPDLGEGLVLVFRRSKNRSPELTVSLDGLDPAATYELEDVDTATRWRATGQDLRDGWTIKLDQPRTSRLVFYRKK